MERATRKGIFPYYGASGVIDSIDNYLFDGEYVLISEDGENLSSRQTPIAFKVNGKFWVNNHAHIVKGKDAHINDLIIYFFAGLDLTPYITGAVQPKLSKENLLCIPIWIPTSKHEQQAIAEVLSSLDDKIDLLHRQNKTLEAIAETLFRQWFVEEADESWEEKSLDDIAIFLNGLACQKYPPKKNEIGLPVIKIKEMRTGITENSDYVSTDIPNQYVIEDGDMLFSWSGSLDIVLWFGGKGVLNQHLFKVSSNNYPQWFYYFWVKHHLNDFQSIAVDKATTMGHIQRHHLSDAVVLIPFKERLKQMNKEISPIFTKIKLITLQIRTLTQLRDTLLPKLMSGEVRVSEQDFKD